MLEARSCAAPVAIRWALAYAQAVCFFFLENVTDQRELAVLVSYLFVDISVFRGFSLKLKDHLVLRVNAMG